MKYLIAIIFLMFATSTVYAAGDVNCCKMCCHSAQCIMTHGPSHQCDKHPPCK